MEESTTKSSSPRKVNIEKAAKINKKSHGRKERKDMSHVAVHGTAVPFFDSDSPL